MDTTNGYNAMIVTEIASEQVVDSLKDVSYPAGAYASGVD